MKRMRATEMLRYPVLLLAATALAVGSPLAAWAHNFGVEVTLGRANPSLSEDPRCPDDSCDSCEPNEEDRGQQDQGSASESSTSASGTLPDSNASDAGDPVSTYTGSFRYAQTDLVVPGVMPIRMIRRYESQSLYDSPLGYGWSFGYDMRLYKYPDGIVAVRTRCGQVDEYLENGGTLQVVDPERGRASELVDNGDGTHTLTYRGGGVALFDLEGRLAELRDRQGNRLAMTYSPTKMALQGISPFALDPSASQTVAYTWQLARIEEQLADGTVTGRDVEIEYDPTTGRVTAIESYDGRRVTYEHEETPGDPFSNRGNLSQVTGLEDVVHTYLYEDTEDPHNLTSIRDGQATEALVIQYDTEDRVLTQVRGESRWTFDYTIPLQETTVERRVVGLSSADAVTTFKFDGAGFLTEKLDALGNKFVYVRDPLNPPYLDRLETWEPNGLGGFDLLKTVDYTYDLAGNLTERSITLDSGETVTEEWEYEDDWIGAREISSSLDPQRRFRTEFTFERGGLPPSDPDYDPSARITNISEIKRVTGWDGGAPAAPTGYETTVLEYDANGQLERITPPVVTPDDQLQIVRTYYDATASQPGLLERIELEVAGVPDPHLKRSFTYDSRGYVDTIADARDNVTDLGWDDRGRLTSVKNALEEETLYTYSGPNETTDYGGGGTAPPGLLLETVEVGRTVAAGEGQLRRFRYDARSRLVEVERKDDLGTFRSFVTMSYDSDGNRLTSDDALGRTLTFTYDLLRRLTSVTDEVNNHTSFGYDAVGNRTLVTDASNRDTIFGYDDRNRLVSIDADAEDLVTSFRYDAAGSVTKVTDPQLQETVYDYDLLSRLTSVEQDLGETVRYDYDGRGRLERVVNARGQVLDSFYLPWGGIERVEHFQNEAAADDPETDSDRIVSYTYDVGGNLRSTSDTDLSTAAPDGADPALEPAGRLFTFVYDDLNRVESATAHYLPGGTPGEGRTLISGYDAFGNRTTLDLSGAGEALAHIWRFDKLDRLFEAVLPGGADPTVSFEYLSSDDLDVLTHGNGATTDVDYEDHGPIDTLTVEDIVGSELHKLDYDYDALLNVDTIREFVNGSERTRTGGATPAYDYGYDGVDRLTEALYPENVGLPTEEEFDYDDAGNREDRVDSALYDYDANNRIRASPGRGYELDADGNTVEINDGGNPSPTVLANLTFDNTSRLRTYQDVGTGTTTTYLYDPFGRRIRKEAGAATTWYLWDGDRLLAEYGGSGTRQARYANGAGFAPLQYAEGAPGSETIYDVHTDSLDTPRMLTDASGSVEWRAVHEAFGEARLDPGNTVSGFNIRFPGQYYDDETGLHYNRFRYYDPEVGRYISADPIGQLGGVNLYTYAANSPTNFTDPTGLIIGPAVRVALTPVIGATNAGGAGVVGGVFGGGAVSVASAFGATGSLPDEARAAAAGAALSGGITARALATSLAAQGSPVGAVATAFVGGFSLGTALNDAFNLATGTTLGDLLFDFLNPPDSPAGPQCSEGGPGDDGGGGGDGGGGFRGFLGGANFGGF